MRRTDALLFPPGAGALSITITVRILFLSPLPRPVRLASFAEITAQNIGRVARPYPERAGDAYLAEREHPRKSIDGPHSLHICLVPGHTQSATASVYSRRFPPSTGTQDEGQKHNCQTSHHRTLHMSTTSRDATPPRGEQKQKQSPLPTRQLCLKGPKISLSMISIPSHRRHDYHHGHHHPTRTTH